MNYKTSLIDFDVECLTACWIIATTFMLLKGYLYIKLVRETLKNLKSWEFEKVRLIHNSIVDYFQY